MPKNGSFEEEYRSTTSYWSDKPSSILESNNERLIPGTVLDIGAGDGRNSLYLAKQGHHVHALDLSKTGLENLVEKATQSEIDSFVRTTVANFVTYMPVEQYDNIVTNFTIHFVGPKNIYTFIQKMMDATKPGGVNVIDDFTQNGPLAIKPDYFLTQDSVASIYASEGWEILVNELRSVKTKAEKAPGVHYTHEAIGFIAKKPAL